MNLYHWRLALRPRNLTTIRLHDLPQPIPQVLCCEPPVAGRGSAAAGPAAAAAASGSSLGRGSGLGEAAHEQVHRHLHVAAGPLQRRLAVLARPRSPAHRHQVVRHAASAEQRAKSRQRGGRGRGAERGERRGAGRCVARASGTACQYRWGGSVSASQCVLLLLIPCPRRVEGGRRQGPAAPTPRGLAAAP